MNIDIGDDEYGDEETGWFSAKDLARAEEEARIREDERERMRESAPRRTRRETRPVFGGEMAEMTMFMDDSWGF